MGLPDFEARKAIELGLETAAGKALIGASERGLKEVLESVGLKQIAQATLPGTESEVPAVATEQGLKRGLASTDIHELTATATAEWRRLRGVYAQEDALGLRQISDDLPGGIYYDNPQGLKRGLDDLPPEVGRHFKGHGIAKGSIGEHIVYSTDF